MKKTIPIFLCYMLCTVINSFSQTYCTPGYISGCSTVAADIDTFQLSGAFSTAFADYGTGCASSSYDDRTSETPVEMYQGSTYTGYITTQFDDTNHVDIWIDFNDDGVFSSSELVDTTNLVGVTSSSFSISIPLLANTGDHRMRVRLVNGDIADASIDPCNTSDYNYGEVHDYTITVLSLVAPPYIVGGTADTVCSGDSVTFTAASSNASAVFKWTGPRGFKKTGSSITLTNVSPYVAGVYKVVIDSAGYYSSPQYDTLAVNATPSSKITTNSPICSGSTLKLSVATTSAPKVTYTWSGPIPIKSGRTASILNADTTASGMYTVTAVSTNGCSSTDSAQVTVWLTPKISSNTFTNPTTCSSHDGVITLSGLLPNTTFSLIYLYNSATISKSVTSNGSGQVVLSGLSPGIYDHIFLISYACVSNIVGPDTLMAPVMPAPPIAGFIGPVCLNDTLNLRSAGTGVGLTYYWTGPDAFRDTTQNPSIPNLTYNDSGVYYVYTVDAAGCTSLPGSTDVFINSLPADPSASGNSPVCLNAELDLSATSSDASASFEWSGPNSFTSSDANPTISNVSFADSGTYTVYAVENGCLSANPATYSVMVEPLPAPPTALSNTPICSGPGDTLKLYASDTETGVNYTWNGPNGFSSTSQNPIIENVTPDDSGLYIVSTMLNGCMSATADTIDAIINTTIDTPVVTDYTYCLNTPTTALAATGRQLLWSIDFPGNRTTAIPPVPYDTLPGLQKYYVTQTGTNGCTSLPVLQTVTVYGLTPTPYAATTAYTYCQYDSSAILSAIGQNLLWYSDSVGGTGSMLAPTPSTSLPGEFYYYVSQTVNGCESKERLPITVTVKAKPGPPSVSSPVVYCQNDAATPLTAVGSNLLWYLNSSGGLGSSTAPTPVTSYPSDTFYFYVSQTVNGCESDRAKIKVIIKEKPNVLIVGRAPFVCQYDTLSFTYYGSASDSASYQWSAPEGATIVSGSGQGPIVISFDSSGKLPLTLTVNDAGCVAPISTYTVDVRKAPTLPLTVPKDACVGQVVSIESGATNEVIDQYNWDYNGGTIIYGNTGAGPYGVSYSIPGPKYISLQGIANSCPSLKTYDTLNVHPLGDAHIAQVSNTNICAGDSVNFSVENPNRAYLYQWSPDNFFNLENNKPEVYAYINVSSVISLKVTTEYGCVSADSVKINAQACCTLNFPNAFSPNGDGKNDIFRPIPGQGHHQIKKFEVVDRWGQVMFETADQNLGWDGTAHGVPQDIGTYYYTISYVCADGKTYNESGVIMLIK